MTSLSNIARRETDPKVIRSGHSSLSTADRLGKALGWFSLGLGAYELLAPHRITRALGMQGNEQLVRIYGAREITSGVLSLSTERSLGLWSRVGGDVVDIATLLLAPRGYRRERENAKAALALVAGVTLIDLMTARSLSTIHRRVRGTGDVYRDRSGFPNRSNTTSRA